jgi:Fe-S-cluster-containing dehydrogenase component/formate-dependent nitrite reductase membrane component NrfD
MMSVDSYVNPGDFTKNYGFVIDNRACIGCHACSVACKSENEVPLGVNRTWVKYVETGLFPDARRHFQVTRCNHCANPPCVRICPVEAMYQRADGIVEFDGGICIGCKACLQACPYDAIYIDPESGTAAKCHYCAHRTDIGLEPACVVVCPEHAIIAGDMNEPNNEISRILAGQDVTVRKPEQGTAPKLFYIEGNDVVMHPTATERTPETYMWADVLPLHGEGQNGHSPSVSGFPPAKPRNPTLAASEAMIRSPQMQAQPWNGPIQLGQGRAAEQMVQVSYNAQHRLPWHWPVPAYLVTKAIAAGSFMLLSLGWGLNWFPFDGLTAVVAGAATLLFMLLTTGLLVFDLEKPERFLLILLRPQWKSWLARGAIFLMGFSGVAGIWWVLELANYFNWFAVSESIRPLFYIVGFVLAAGVAVYTAFLFAQAEGRDLWQSPLLPFHLLLQSFLAGSGALLVLLPFTDPSVEIVATSATVFVVALIIDLFVTLTGEFGIPHASEVAARAAHEISRGRYRRMFWWGSIFLGHLLPLLLMAAAFFAIDAWILPLLAGLAAIAGLYLYEYAFVMAPQEIPNS